MRRFKNILVIAGADTDTGENVAIARGAALARRNDARLTLMDVVSAPPATLKQYKGIIDIDELTDLVQSERKKALDHIAAPLLRDGIEVITKVASGRDFIEIIRQVLQGGHDLVIKTAERSTGIFAGGDLHLMRKCPRPVWLLKSALGAGSGKILAAVDLALEADAEGQALNTLIMDLATTLSRWEGGELHMLSCWTLYSESALRHSAFLNVPDAEIEALLDAEQAAQQRCQRQLCARYNDVPFVKHLVKGNPDTCIPTFVRDHEIGTVVMGTVGRSGIPGLFIGNTAETVLQSIDTSVITVKPAGFESPVR
ncbi:hypothetical protein FKG94_02695 [Exilibacterium tricleocarpae]|uniref:UspA domain-containing protein n=1 Tax=Exilibacterium tricleocarpae TaxID=2591008 RepID=A0A545U6M3_9GAMM|nr:universal stress protein [Exilibacterium tricleocarpae]TQV85116.1 hypothetical protein FKG94_02695 [Exilibacterium tricleocarpae]